MGASLPHFARCFERLGFAPWYAALRENELCGSLEGSLCNGIAALGFLFGIISLSLSVSIRLFLYYIFFLSLTLFRSFEGYFSRELAPLFLYPMCAHQTSASLSGFRNELVFCFSLTALFVINVASLL